MKNLKLVTPLNPGWSVTAADIPRLVPYLVPAGDEQRAKSLVKFAATMARADRDICAEICDRIEMLISNTEKKAVVLWEVRSLVRKSKVNSGEFKHTANQIAELVEFRDQAVALSDLARLLLGEKSEALRESLAVAVGDECFRRTNAFSDAALRFFESLAPFPRVHQLQAV